MSSRMSHPIDWRHLYDLICDSKRWRYAEWCQFKTLDEFAFNDVIGYKFKAFYTLDDMAVEFVCMEQFTVKEVRVWWASESATHSWVPRVFRKAWRVLQSWWWAPRRGAYTLPRGISTEGVRGNRRTRTEPDRVFHQSVFNLDMKCRRALIIKR